MGKGLSRLVQAQYASEEIHGLNLHKGMDKKTHQQFMDDMMLMGHPSVHEARAFKRGLKLFAKDLGLVVNIDKSQVFFLNTTSIVQRNIVRTMGFAKVFLRPQNVLHSCYSACPK